MQPIVDINKPLPNWELTSIFGDDIPHIEDFKGKPLLILFFNLGCPGCKGRALPFANKMVYEHEDAMNVIGIHTRFEGPEREEEDFIKAKEDYYIRFPFYRDANLSATFHRYLAGGTPHWLLLDEKGILQYSVFGSDPNNALLRLDFKIGELID